MNTIVLHINHCMENSFEFSRMLGNIFPTVIFVGVPYNNCIAPADPAFTSYSAVEEEEGSFLLFKNQSRTGEYNGGLSDCTFFMIQIAVKQDILPLLAEGKRLLIFEDGGYHYQVFRELAVDYPHLYSRILGVVEQTTFGTVKGSRSGTEETFEYPHLSVARSAIKMNVESFFIAERVVEELSLYLYSINTFLDFHRILLIGYGVVGRRIAEILSSRKTDLHVYDIQPYIRKVALDDGQQVVEEITPEEFVTDTIILGNTGCASFTEDMLTAFFKGAARRIYLVSTSSQEVEFLVFLEMLKGDRPFPKGVVLQDQKCFDGIDIYLFSYEINGTKEVKEICLIAKGRPVNFYRQNIISLTNSVIDLVFSEMMYLGVWLCHHPDMEKRLYLLGYDPVFSGEGIEEELFEKWLSLYQLSRSAGMEAFMDAHPASDLLKKGVFEKNGS